jgi:hypothetical protein
VPFVTLAALGTAFAWKTSPVRSIACLAAASWIYALGGFTFVQGLFYIFVPLAEKARTPAAALHIFHLAAAVLAAFGMDALGSASAESKAMRRAAIALVALGAVLAVDIQYLKPPDLDPRFGISMLAAWLTAAMLRWKHAPVALTALMLFETNANTGSLIAPRSDKGRTEWMDRMRDNRDIAAFLKSRPGPFRVTVDSAFEENWGAWHGIEMRHGYLASLSTNIADWPGSADGDRLFNTRYSIDRRPQGFHTEEVFQGASGLKVFADPEALPRAWAVHRTVKAESAEAVRARIHQNPAEFRTTAFFAGTPPAAAGACEGSSVVETRSATENSIELLATMRCDGVAVIAMTAFPGWIATVDGKPAQIHEANALMPSVAVPAGRHSIRLKYQPLSVALGGALTVTGLLAAGALAAKAKRQA